MNNGEAQTRPTRTAGGRALYPEASDTAVPIDSATLHLPRVFHKIWRRIAGGRFTGRIVLDCHDGKVKKVEETSIAFVSEEDSR